MAISRKFSKESGMGGSETEAVLRQLSAIRVGQRYPTDYPTLPAPGKAKLAGEDRLGKPLDIRQVAKLVGCSPWSIRNTWIPKGLPYFRSGASSKLIFYEAQVTRWIEQKQQGG